MRGSARAIARGSVLRTRVEERRYDEVGKPRPLSAGDRRVLALTIVAILIGGYLVMQLIGLATTKDAVPPFWLIEAPAGAEIEGQPTVGYEPYRATTYVTVRPTDGRSPAELLEEMGLSEQPTQMGRTLLDWRPVWVYGRSTSDGVELRLVYRPDTH